MKYKKLLFDLIDYLDAFESLHDGGSHEPEIKDFADFLSWRCGKKRNRRKKLSLSPGNEQQELRI
mgnify:CR=1 FL=1